MHKFLFFFLLINALVLQGQDTLFSENFDSGTLPLGWEIIDNDGYTVHPSVIDFSDAWVVVEDPADASNFVVGSTSYFQPVDRADRWLISPEITLGNDGNVLKWFAKSQDPSFPDSYKVLIAPNGGNQISDFTDTIALVSNELPQGSTRMFSLPNYADLTVRFAFVNTTFNGFVLYLDEIHVFENDVLNVDDFKNESMSVKIYPNPSDGLVNVLSSELLSSVAVYDVSGKLIFQDKQINSMSMNMNLSGVNKGIYFAHIQTEQGKMVRHKFVIQ